MVRFPVYNWPVAALALLTACGAEPSSAPLDGTDAPLDTAQLPIVNGADSPSSEDFVLQVRNDDSKLFFTAVLVSPTLALTVRHGVIRDSGSGIFGCSLGTNVSPPERFKLYTGPNFGVGRELSVKRVFVDLSSSACEGDIAAFELSEPLAIPTPSIALDALPAIGATVTAIGWGTTDEVTLVGAQVRQRRTGQVISLDGGATYQTVDGPVAGILARGALAVVASGLGTCDSDSGGAVVDNAGALQGLVSLGFGVDQTLRLCETGVTVATSVRAQTSFIERAFQSVGRMPTRAGKPEPRELGGECTQSNECHSNFCVGTGARSFCSKVCQTNEECGGTSTCTDSGQLTTDGEPVSVCLDSPAAPVPDGCSAHGAGASGFAPATAWLLLMLKRRKRR